MVNYLNFIYHYIASTSREETNFYIDPFAQNECFLLFICMEFLLFFLHVFFLLLRNYVRGRTFDTFICVALSWGVRWIRIFFKPPDPDPQNFLNAEQEIVLVAIKHNNIITSSYFLHLFF